KFLGEAIPMIGCNEYRSYAPGEDVNTFIRELQPHQPKLIILDTLARCLVGGDEDSAKDMGLFIEAADRIRQKLNATVLILHHPVKKGGRERGSGALLAGVETMMSLTDSGGMRTLTCEKQKDARLFDPIHFQLVQVTLPDEQSSLCAVPLDQ